MATGERIDKIPNPPRVQGCNSLTAPAMPHHQGSRKTDVGLAAGARSTRFATLASGRIEAFSPALIIGITMRSRLGSICSSLKKLLLIGPIDESPPFRYRCRPRAYCCCRLYRHRRAGARRRYPKPQRDHRRHLGSYDDPVGRYARRRSDVPHRTTASLSSAPGVTEPALRHASSRPRGSALAATR